MAVLEGNMAFVTCLALDSQSIVSGGQDKTVRVWSETATGKFESKRTLEGHTAAVQRVWLCAPPHDHIVVAVDLAKCVRVHNMRTGQLVFAPIECDCKCTGSPTPVGAGQSLNS